jgi:hypothetical protein
MSHTGQVGAAFQLVLLISLSVPACGGDASGWRTDGTGYYADADPPKTWSDQENVVWKTELPGRSHSSPVVSAGRVFVCSDPAELLCLNVSDGEILWQKSHQWSDVFPPEKVAEIEASYVQAKVLEEQRKQLHREFGELRKADPEGNKARIEELKEQAVSLESRRKELLRYPPPRRGASGNSAATPVTDGHIVVALFGTGVLAAHTVEGERLWMTHIEVPQSGFGHSASPVLVDGLVIVHIHDMVALDAKTGEEVWRTKLPARWGTPVATTIGDTRVIVSPGGSIIRANDGVELASKLFRLGNNSPIVAGNIVYAMDPDGFRAFRLPDEAAEPVEVEVLWEGGGTRQRSFASPVLHDGQIFSVTESGIFEVTDAATGKLIERRRMEFKKGRVYASVTAAGGLVFVGCDNGETSVMKADGDFEEVARNRCEGYSSCPVFAGKRAFLRTRSHLYCISDDGP